MKKILKLLTRTPIQLVLCILFASTVGNFLPVQLINFTYSLSCLLKEILMVMLPIIIFAYLTGALLSFAKHGPILILSVLLMVCISNSCIVLTSYTIGNYLLPLITHTNMEGSIAQIESKINGLWSWHIPTLLAPNHSLIAGIFVGLMGGIFNIVELKNIVHKLRKYVDIFLQKVFMPLLPVYILGFLLKMQYEGSLIEIANNYSKVLIAIFILITIYLFLMYLFAAKFNFSRAIKFIKEMLPAGITGFSTMSSTATMPVTLKATEKNLGHKAFADFVIPTTLGMHMVGDGISIVLIALSLLIMNGQGIPDFSVYLTFVIYYCIAKFSCAGVSGGTIFILLTIMQEYLNISPNLTPIILILNLLLDPFITSSNVMGNGAFAIISKKILQKLKVF